jgi:hypothetical protein
MNSNLHKSAEGFMEILSIYSAIGKGSSLLIKKKNFS